MIYTPMTKAAMLLCWEAHRDQKDKSGMPYVFHPFHVAEQMETEEATAVALLHDVAEDSEITLEEIACRGFPQSVTDALALLTHAPGTDYMDYIRNLKSNPVARAVKLADLRHNSDLSRLDRVDEKALKREKKYRQAIELLES